MSFRSCIRAHPQPEEAPTKATLILCMWCVHGHGRSKAWRAIYRYTCTPIVRTTIAIAS